MSPLRIEPRINGIKLSENKLKENGFIELAKVLLFNQNIKTIDFHASLIKSSYIYLLNYTLGLFENNSVEVLDLSFNYLKLDCEEYLATILTHFKKVKTINLSSNNLKSGITSFLITLKKLYKQGKCNLERLNLNKCNLDDLSYYELGELLKSKYCKLKKLYLNQNNIPSNINFFRKLKKNKSLTQIYFNKNTIGNNEVHAIMRIISNSNIEYLYLNKNKINDFSQCLRILFRTRLIKREKEIIKGNSVLYNLDISHNICFNKNKEKIELFKVICKETSLYCLDASQIIYDNNPDKYKKKKVLNKKYFASVEDLIKKISLNQNEFNENIGYLNNNLIDQKKLLKIEYNKNFKILDDQILYIAQDNNSKYDQFLKKSAKLLISNNKSAKNAIINGREDNVKIKKIEDNLAKY